MREYSRVSASLFTKGGGRMVTYAVAASAATGRGEGAPAEGPGRLAFAGTTRLRTVRGGKKNKTKINKTQRYLPIK